MKQDEDENIEGNEDSPKKERIVLKPPFEYESKEPSDPEMDKFLKENYPNYMDPRYWNSKTPSYLMDHVENPITCINCGILYDPAESDAMDPSSFCSMNCEMKNQ